MMKTALLLLLLLLPGLAACTPKAVPDLDERLRLRMLPAPPLAAPAPSWSGEETPAPEPLFEDAAADRFSSLPARPQPEWSPTLRPDPAQLFDDRAKLSAVVDEMALPDFIHRVFGDLLKVNYHLDSKVAAGEKVSLNLLDITPRALFVAVREILADHKVAVEESAGLFTIAPAPAAPPLTMGLGARPADLPALLPGQVRQIVPLRHAVAQNLMQVISAVPGTMVVVLPGENALAVTGPREGVEQVMHFLELLDRPAMRGRHVGMFRLAFSDPVALAAKLKEILRVEGVPVGDGAQQGGLQFVTLDRWRLLLVFAAEPEWLQRTRHWVEVLDIPEESDQRRYFLFFPENSRAVELLETIETILGLPAGARPAADSERNRQGGGEWFSPAAGAGVAEAAVKPPTTGSLAALGDGVRVAADESRNALIVYATPQHYHALESLLRRLDIMPAQVLIEATVAEVTLIGELKYGLEWYLKNSDSSRNEVLQTLGGLGLGSAGLNYSLVNASQRFQVLVNALAEEELVKVLSSPRIMVRDGKGASITVGTQVPVVTSDTARVDAGGDERTGVVRTYQYRTTGVSLQVTPTVHAQGVVTLEISQDVSEPAASGGENPLILNRTISTEVVAASGQTVLLGGLIKESEGRRESKVPLLGDLPGLGHLFKTTSRGGERTELVVMFTPHIIRSTQELDEIGRAIFKEFRQLEMTGP